MPIVIGHDSEVAKRVTCKNCGSIIEYFPYEVRRIKHSMDYLGDYEVDSGIDCPKCEKHVFIR